MAGIVISALYFFLPAYVANTSAGLFGHGRPLDLGNNFIDGKRLFGDGVTIRGLASGILVGSLVGVLQRILTGDLGSMVILGVLLSSGALAGDAAGSFIKRRVGKPKGSPLFPLDQLNFVVGG
ncbi:MAG: CDP-archaeol synthase, partial [Candidatus Hydrothermarchaeales archaeon]